MGTSLLLYGLLYGVIECISDIDQISAGLPPIVTPPNEKCTCEWSEWMSGDSPKEGDGKFHHLYLSGDNEHAKNIFFGRRFLSRRFFFFIFYGILKIKKRISMINIPSLKFCQLNSFRNSYALGIMKQK